MTSLSRPILSADKEIIMAIQALAKTRETRISFNHVEGHPEKRKCKEDFDPIELANFECDRDAELRIDGQDAPLEYTPLNGSLCAVRIGKKWLYLIDQITPSKRPLCCQN
jgi:hypothetical protein